MNFVNNPAWFLDYNRTPIEQLIQVHVEVEYEDATTDYIPCTIKNKDDVGNVGGQIQNVHYSIKGVSEAKYILKRRKELGFLPSSIQEKILKLAADKLHFWIDNPSDYNKDIAWLINRRWHGQESPKVINNAYNKKR